MSFLLVFLVWYIVATVISLIFLAVIVLVFDRELNLLASSAIITLTMVCTLGAVYIL